MSMDCSSQSHLFLLLLLLLLRFSSCNGDPNTYCKEIERKALIKFKEGIRDPAGRLSSWTGKDCCRWRGVGCNNKTGHVVQLNLRNPSQYLSAGDDFQTWKTSSLSGEINPSLLNLTHLKYLDLSMNYFRGIQIPDFLGSFKNLRYLNLCNALFVGTIPPSLGNLSTLHQLDLSCSFCYNLLYESSYYVPFRLRVDNLHWISHLSSLEYLDMGYVNLTNAADDWFQAFNKLSLLQEIRLRSCELQTLPLFPPFVNFTSLSVLYLSWNCFNSSLPHWLLNISSLRDLDLAYNQLNLDLSGSAPGSLYKLQRLDLPFNNGGGLGALVDSLSSCANKSLEILNLQYNGLSGHLPKSIGHFLSLKELNLAENQISGPIPESFGLLSKLVSVTLDSNYWEGVISENHFAKLTNLKDISISSWSRNNALVFDVRQEWVPTFKLELKFPLLLATVCSFLFSSLLCVAVFLLDRPSIFC